MLQFPLSAHMWLDHLFQILALLPVYKSNVCVQYLQLKCRRLGTEDSVNKSISIFSTLSPKPEQFVVVAGLDKCISK